MRRPARILLAIPAVLLIAALAFSASHLAAPSWDVTVVNPNGESISNISVTETWQDYSCEQEEHTATLSTDSHGEAHFPPVYSHRNLAKCALETASELTGGVHASLGPHVRIDVQSLVCVCDSHNNCVNWTGSPTRMSSRVTLNNSPR